MGPSNEERRSEMGYTPHYEVVNWSRKARIVAGAVAIAVLVVGQRTKGVARQLASFAGMSLGLRALLNKDLTQVIGTLLSPTIRLSREIIVNAPGDEVVMFWSKIENYPRFMSFVNKMDTSRCGNLLWEIAGPGGVKIHWESYILAWGKGGAIAWQTIPGSPIFNSGRVIIQPLEFGRSKLKVELAYALRAGSLGYAAARILGFDPRAHIDADLAKMKWLIEEEWQTKQTSELSLSS